MLELTGHTQYLFKEGYFSSMTVSPSEMFLIPTNIWEHMLSKIVQVSFLVSFGGCPHFGAVFLFPQTAIMLWHNGTGSALGFPLEEVQWGEFDESIVKCFPKPHCPGSIIEGHCNGAHSYCSNYKEQSFHFLCVGACGIMVHGFHWFFRTQGHDECRTAQWAECMAGSEESSHLNHRFGGFVAVI